MCVRIAVLLREAEVDGVHLCGVCACAHQEVVGLDVAMDEVLGVKKFYAKDWVRLEKGIIRKKGESEKKRRTKSIEINII